MKKNIQIGTWGTIGFLASYNGRFFDGGYTGIRHTKSGVDRNYYDEADIPYKGVKQYGTSKNFNYNRFWNWAEKMSVNNIVLVSEHVAPENWDCIWKQEITRMIDYTKRTKAVEKLFEIG